ncbi:MAG: phage portal protein [Cystobacter sp.]
MAGALARIKSWVEGAWRGPFFGVGERGGMYELGPLEDGWQRNLEHPRSGARMVPAAYAAVMANAKAVAQCYPSHMRKTGPGRYEHNTTSPAFRVFRQPNPYETWPVWMLNMLATMQFAGTAHAVAIRNDRGDIAELHRMPKGTCMPYVSPEDGSVYYAVGSNQMLPNFGGVDAMVPARDVLVLRQYCPRHPLIGEPPATAAALAMGVNVALSQSQAVFYARMSRPSGVLSTDQQLTKEQFQRLRQNWDAQSTMLNQGGVPILGNGVKWVSMSIDSESAEVNLAQRMSIEEIARVYGVPLPVIGDLSHATLTNVEALISFWLSTGLGSLLDLVERAFDQLFGFDSVNDYTELDQKALLRTDFAGRVEALCKGIQGALYKPDEARAEMGLPPVDGGDKVYAQTQMQPLGTPLPAPAPAPAPSGDEDPEDPDAPPPDEDESKDLSAERIRQQLLERVMA